MFDCQLGELLTVTVQLAIAFSSLLVENKNFIALYQACFYFANNLSAFYYRSTYGDCTVVVNQQHFLKFNSCTGLGTLNVVNEELLALFCLELLTVNFYDYVHYLYYIKRFLRKVDASLAPLFRTSTD